MARSVTFERSGVMFIARFISPAVDDDGQIIPDLVKNENKWELSRASYHQNTWMRPLKRKPSEQLPRWKRIGYFDSLEEAKARAEGTVRES